MVIGLLAITAIPTVTGVAFGVSEQRKRNKQEDDAPRMAKFYLDVFCEANTRKAKEINGKRVVFRDGGLWIDDADPSKRKKPSYSVQAFYIQYPDDGRKGMLGLVAPIAEDPPLLNWIYADKDTSQLKHGNRTQSIEHIVGPWDWTEDEAGLTIEGWEGFCAVEEYPGEWAVYYDKKDNKLKDVVPNKRVLQLSLERKLLEEEKK